MRLTHLNLGVRNICKQTIGYMVLRFFVFIDGYYWVLIRVIYRIFNRNECNQFNIQTTFRENLTFIFHNKITYISHAFRDTLYKIKLFIFITAYVHTLSIYRNAYNDIYLIINLKWQLLSDYVLAWKPLKSIEKQILISLCKYIFARNSDNHK